MADYNTMKKEDLVNELKEKDIKIQGIEDKFDELKKMFLESIEAKKNEQVNNIVETKIEKPTKKVRDDVVQIGSNLIGKHILCDRTGTELIEFDDFGDVATLRASIVDSLLTSKNKQLFRDGLIYFLDDSIYELHSLKKNHVLNEETIDKIYKLDINSMIVEFNKLTNSGTNDSVKFSLYWYIVKSIASGKEGYSDKSKEITVGNYFNVDINNSIKLLTYAQEVNFFK